MWSPRPSRPAASTASTSRPAAPTPRPNASDGIFVYAGPASLPRAYPAVGTTVTVTGTAKEFAIGGTTLTEIDVANAGRRSPPPRPRSRPSSPRPSSPAPTAPRAPARTAAALDDRPREGRGRALRPDRQLHRHRRLRRLAVPEHLVGQLRRDRPGGREHQGARPADRALRRPDPGRADRRPHGLQRRAPDHPRRRLEPQLHAGRQHRHADPVVHRRPTTCATAPR